MKKIVSFILNDKDFSIREYKKGDEQILLPLMNKNFDEKWTLEDWNWKYNENPVGFSGLILLNKKESIVGQFGHLFKKWKVYDKEYKALMGVDVFVDKNYQGYGLTGKMFRYLHNFYPKKDFFHYGFPNDTALKAYSKSGDFYKNYNISKTYYLYKKYNLFSKLQFNFKNSKHSLNISRLSEDNKQEVDNLWNKKKKELEVCVVRDFEYLNRRILQSPEKMELFLIKHNNETVGYFSIMIRDKVCYITDILILNDFTNKNIINEIERFCLKFSPKEIRIFVTDKLISNILKNFKFNLFDIGLFTYYNNIEKSVKILPYLTFSDFDSV